MFTIKRICFHRGQNQNYLTRPGILLVAIAAIFWASSSFARQEGYLENPLDFGSESGIGAITGFHCLAQAVEIQFDDYDPILATRAPLTSRNDTLDYCGHTETGFSLLFNWNLLGPGQHTVKALADGVEFDRATITVSTFGTEFIWGLNMQVDTMAVEAGKEVSLRWSEAKQGFVIEDIKDAGYDKDDIIAALSGSWTGSWHSPTNSGSISMDISAGYYAYLALDSFGITSTGCAGSGFAHNELLSMTEPLWELLMDDGSMLELEFFVTESFTTLGGVFRIEGGACDGTDGMFYMFR